MAELEPVQSNPVHKSVCSDRQSVLSRSSDHLGTSSTDRITCLGPWWYNLDRTSTDSLTRLHQWVFLLPGNHGTSMSYVNHLGCHILIHMHRNRWSNHETDTRLVPNVQRWYMNSKTPFGYADSQRADRPI